MGGRTHGPPSGRSWACIEAKRARLPLKSTVRDRRVGAAMGTRQCVAFRPERSIRVEPLRAPCSKPRRTTRPCAAKPSRWSAPRIARDRCAPTPVVARHVRTRTRRRRRGRRPARAASLADRCPLARPFRQPAHLQSRSPRGRRRIRADRRRVFRHRPVPHRRPLHRAGQGRPTASTLVRRPSEGDSRLRHLGARIGD